MKRRVPSPPADGAEQPVDPPPSSSIDRMGWSGMSRDVRLKLHAPGQFEPQQHSAWWSVPDHWPNQAL